MAPKCPVQSCVGCVGRIRLRCGRAKFKALPLMLRSHSQPQQLELWLEAQNESWRLSALRLQMHFWLTTR